MVSCIFKVRSRVQKEEKYQSCRKIDLVKNIIREISIGYGKWRNMMEDRFTKLILLNLKIIIIVKLNQI